MLVSTDCIFSCLLKLSWLRTMFWNVVWWLLFLVILAALMSSTHAMRHPQIQEGRNQLKAKVMKLRLQLLKLTLNALFRDDFFFPFIFISWRLITLQYCSGFCHRLTWISHGFTCVPHPDPPSHLPLHPIPLGHLSASALSTCLMYPAWAGDLFHPR